MKLARHVDLPGMDERKFRECVSKVQYPTKEAAREKMIELARKTSARLRSYRCWQCDKWHLTGKPYKDQGQALCGVCLQPADGPEWACAKCRGEAKP